MTPMRSLPTLVIGGVTTVLLLLLLWQVAGLRGEVDTLRADASAAAEAAAEAATAASDAATAAGGIADVRDMVEQLNAEIAALPRTGVVPTDSSQLILQRIDEIRDLLTSLASRVDDICRNAPVSLC